MRQQLRWNVEPFIPSIFDGTLEMCGIPVDDDCRKQIQPGDPVMLTFRGSIADFPLASNAQGVFRA